MRHMKENFKKIHSRYTENYRRRESILLDRGIIAYMFNSAGYVLIIVLLMTSLLVSVSSEFLIVAQTNINYIRKFSEKQKASLMAKSGIKLATFILEADRKGIITDLLPRKPDKNIDCYDDLWALNFPEISLEGGNLKIIITDENSKINVNILANEFVDKTPYYGVTQRFFLNLGLSQDHADTIIDWVDIDDSRFPYGAESSDYYLNLDNPYKAKNGAMDSIDELLLIKGITPEIFYGLGGGNYGQEENLVIDNKGSKNLSISMFSDLSKDTLKNDFQDLEVKIGKEKSRGFSYYFRTHGKRSDYLSDLNKININTASFRVLSALTDHMTDDIVTEIIRRRREKPFTTIDEINDLIKDESIRKNLLTVRSYFFKIESIGRVKNTRVKITGVYYRDGKKFYYWSEQ
jgi:type II secretory pathway component PulK